MNVKQNNDATVAPNIELSDMRALNSKSIRVYNNGAAYSIPESYNELIATKNKFVDIYCLNYMCHVKIVWHQFYILIQQIFALKSKHLKILIYCNGFSETDKEQMLSFFNKQELSFLLDKNYLSVDFCTFDAELEFYEISLLSNIKHMASLSKIQFILFPNYCVAFSDSEHNLSMIMKPLKFVNTTKFIEDLSTANATRSISIYDILHFVYLYSIEVLPNAIDQLQREILAIYSVSSTLSHYKR